jgi:hypothetical protein
MTNYDLIIIGAGSGGIGAALAAARLGATVLLVERAGQIGGNAAVSGVSVWEMGVGGTGIPFDIYKRLKQLPDAVGIYRFNKHRKWQLQMGETPGRSAGAVDSPGVDSPGVDSLLHPGAEIVIDPTRRYADTLRRFGSETGIQNEEFVRKHWHGVPFEPAAYQQVVEDMLTETGNITLLLNTSFVGVDFTDGRIKALMLSNGQTATATTYIDSTDSGVLCRAIGCAMRQGQESHALFGEPGAPDTPTNKLNGVTLIYRVTPKSDDNIDSLPTDIPETCWWSDSFPPTSIVQYPNRSAGAGDWNLNMLPTMEGAEWAAYENPAEAYAECQRRVQAHWHHIQSTYKEYRSFRLSWMAPALGVRESSRVTGEYVLTENDIRAGLSGQIERDFVTIADHALDTHGTTTGRAGCAELAEPYGVPFRCLIPQHFRNVLVASRAASFSSLAASSCRLSRTMMQLGQAAGTAAFLAKTLGIDVANVPYADLRPLLEAQHVQLTYPASAAIQAHLAHE